MPVCFYQLHQPPAQPFEPYRPRRQGRATAARSSWLLLRGQMAHRMYPHLFSGPLRFRPEQIRSRSLGRWDTAFGQADGWMTSPRYRLIWASLEHHTIADYRYSLVNEPWSFLRLCFVDIDVLETFARQVGILRRDLTLGHDRLQHLRSIRRLLMAYFNNKSSAYRRAVDRYRSIHHILLSKGIALQGAIPPRFRKSNRGSVLLLREGTC